MFDATGYKPTPTPEPALSQLVKEQAFERAPLSEKIRLALQDIEQVEQTPAHGVHMSDWIQVVDYEDAMFPGLEEGDCLVCFAGAVMLNTYNAKPFDRLQARFTDKQWCVWRALDKFQEGNIYTGCEYVDMAEGTARAIRDAYYDKVGRHLDYAQDPDAWKSQMRTLADLIEHHGS